MLVKRASDFLRALTGRAHRIVGVVVWVEQRPVTASVSMALLALMAATGVALVAGLPLPQVHDEFAYLLSSDTFAEGRVTNPTHPMWVHFETFHVIHVPSYIAKYPPAQGLFLALGQVVFGHPAVGVWISVALMCMAITWMLFAWVPPRWALCGGGLSVVQLALGSYWAQSYWGGAVASLGGALMFGALPRLARQPHAWHGTLLGLGAGVLAASRPLEGALVCISVGGVLLHCWMTGERPFRLQLWRAVVPGFVVLAFALAILGYFNKRTTGSIARMPYQVHEEVYGLAPTFLWQPADRRLEYRHPEMAQFWAVWERDRHNAMRVPSNFLRQLPKKLADVLSLYLGVGALALLALPFTRSDYWLRIALVTCGLLLVTLLSTKGAFPHYMAPVAGPILVVFIACIRRIGKVHPSWLGAGVVALILVLALGQRIGALSRGGAGPLLRPLPQFGAQRDSVQRALMAQPGSDLVIVHYTSEHRLHEEWIYNRADIDGAAVVWARDMGTRANEDLLEYFGDRRAWLLIVDGRAVSIRPYRGDGDAVDGARPPDEQKGD